MIYLNEYNSLERFYYLQEMVVIIKFVFKICIYLTNIVPFMSREMLCIPVTKVIPYKAYKYCTEHNVKLM